jgi:hypothetical protein
MLPRQPGQARYPRRQVTLGRGTGDRDGVAVGREPPPHGREAGGRPAAARCRRAGVQQGERQPDRGRRRQQQITRVGRDA